MNPVLTVAGAERDPWNVWCTGYPPAGQRRHWLLVVDCCAFCGAGHAHRGGPDGGIRRAGCGGGSYVLLVRGVETEVADGAA